MDEMPLIDIQTIKDLRKMATETLLKEDLIMETLMYQSLTIQILWNQRFALQTLTN